MTREPVPEWCDVIAAKDQEINQIKKENANLRDAILRAIRQHEDGNKGLANRTLCDAVYERQA